jgi:type IV secretion system protein VirB8
VSDRRDYFARAESWSDDSRVAAARSTRMAWTIAGIAIGVAALEAVALAMLAPLKTVQPITLLVDKQTGFVQALDPLTPRRVGADEALTNSLLAQYVTAREEFDRATVGADYRRVALWSGAGPRQVYVAQMPATNPASPFQRYPAGATVDARIKSVSRLGAGVALVRFDTQLQDRNGRADPPQPWLSVVRFRYLDAPMRFEDRLVNPLGFQVVSYRKDAEAPPPSTSPQNALAASPQASSEPAPTRALLSSPAVLVRQPASAPSYTIVAPPAVARRTLRARNDDPQTGTLQRREVPINNLPLGSPLSPSGAPLAMAANAPR